MSIECVWMLVCFFLALTFKNKKKQKKTKKHAIVAAYQIQQ